MEPVRHHPLAWNASEASRTVAEGGALTAANASSCQTFSSNNQPNPPPAVSAAFLRHSPPLHACESASMFVQLGRAAHATCSPPGSRTLQRARVLHTNCPHV